MPETVFDELKRYVEFGRDDEAALRALHPFAAPRFSSIVETFYGRILAHEEARRVLQGGEKGVGHLKVTLTAWLDRLLQGPWDDEYFQARCRIGHMHVRIGLPQHYMFGAMNVIRRGLNDVIDEAYLSEPAALAAARRAVGKILDLELALMLDTYREDLLMQQARVERLSTYGQLVASIGHDLRNPLGVIESSLYILRRHLETGDDRSRKHLGRIGEQLRIANGIIEGLLDIIRDRPLAREEVRIAPLVAGAAGAVPRPDGVRLDLEGLGDLPAVQGDPGQLRQVFVNLLQNAVDAASPAGEIRVRGIAGETGIEVAVEDTGPGVDPMTARRLFEPLTTTKDRGTGLGLALVKRILERHGGEVRYERRDQGGARFSVRLPT